MIRKKLRLKGKVAVVTGASRGIGDCICRLFAGEGAKVIAVDREESLSPQEGIAYIKLDVTDRNAVEAFYKETVKKYGQIDILVNNAGITRDALTGKMTDEQWQSVLDVNLTGVFHMTRYIGPHMEQTGSGSIINISSVVGVYGNIGQANYAATKAGIIGLTMTWAKEFARKGAAVRVNAIAPGYVMTDMLKTVPQALLDQFASLTMLKRLGQPEEIAKVALFLASDESSYITGQTINANGGMRL